MNYTLKEYKDIELSINFKELTVKAAICSDGKTRIPFKMLFDETLWSIPRGFPILITTPDLKVMNDKSFEELVNDSLKDKRGTGTVEGSSRKRNSNRGRVSA